jgi:hypothetical protein
MASTGEIPARFHVVSSGRRNWRNAPPAYSDLMFDIDIQSTEAIRQLVSAMQSIERAQAMPPDQMGEQLNWIEHQVREALSHCEIVWAKVPARDSVDPNKTTLEIAKL